MLQGDFFSSRFFGSGNLVEQRKKILYVTYHLSKTITQEAVLSFAQLPAILINLSVFINSGDADKAIFCPGV